MDGLGYRRFTVQWRGWHEPVMKEDAEARCQRLQFEQCGLE
jgi:hypothetical protein